MVKAAKKQMRNLGLSREDRASASLAWIATANTVFGGASAMVIAKRLERLGSSVPASDIVSDVYGDSTGSVHRRWGVWECPECGSVHLGQEAAAQCCAFDDEYIEDND